MLYETALPDAGPHLLEVEQVRDRAQVFVDGLPVGVLERESHEHTLTLTAPRPGSVLSVLVENQGRVNYGPGIHDRKGLLGEVLLNGGPLTSWTNRPLALTDLVALPFATDTRPPVGPAFRRGSFHVDTPADTFLCLEGWTKGSVWINGFAFGALLVTRSTTVAVCPGAGAADRSQHDRRPGVARRSPRPDGRVPRDGRPRTDRGVGRGRGSRAPADGRSPASPPRAGLGLSCPVRCRRRSRTDCRRWSAGTPRPRPRHRRKHR